jgi:type IV pilus assembly protein PilV
MQTMKTHLFFQNIHDQNTHGQNICGQNIRGITMLENLVAILVLSIGLLGLAGLQGTTMRNSTDATLRSVAVQQAMAMADRIRANPGDVVATNYDNITPANSDEPGTKCDQTACTQAGEVARFDAWEWNTANTNLLPGGGGWVIGAPIAGVAVPAGLPAPRIFTITVGWDANRTGVTASGDVPDCDPQNLQCIELQVVAP